jgi:UDP-GlcNAc:undecaprenyl-phosphate GlcNAc-1-phosphate transferase
MVFIFSAILYSILYFDENIFHNIKYIGFICGGIIAFLMGLADDAYNTRPLLKLLVQILCGVTLVLTDSVIDLTHIFFIDAIFTVLWVVVLMNSLNMLDNMDGITGTTVFFILLSCLVVNWFLLDVNTNIWSITLVSLIGAVLGFLFLNIHPSKLFMGDAGSQFIGFAVAFFCIPNLWNVGHLQITQYPSWTGFVLCLTVLTPAAVDTLTVVINRLKRGQSPMVGGKDHTTHHLVYAGKNDKQVWIIFTLIGLGATLLSLIIVILMKNHQLFFIPFFLLYFLVVFIALYKNTIKYKPTK